MDIKEYIKDKVCRCDIMNGYYCGHIDTVNSIITVVVNSKTDSLDTLVDSYNLLDEARKTIDELREQNIPMRVALQKLVDINWHINDDTYCFDCGQWYGNIPEDKPVPENYTIHDKVCWVYTVKQLLDTIPK